MTSKNSEISIKNAETKHPIMSTNTMNGADNLVAMNIEASLPSEKNAQNRAVM